MSKISVGAEKREEKEYVVCVRYKAHCSLDAMANLKKSLQSDPDFVMVESGELAEGR